MFWSSDQYALASVSERLQLGCPAETRGYYEPSADECTLMRGFPLAYPNSAQLIEEGFVKFTVGFGLIIAFLLNVAIFFWKLYIEKLRKANAKSLTPRLAPGSRFEAVIQVSVAVEQWHLKLPCYFIVLMCRNLQLKFITSPPRSDLSWYMKVRLLQYSILLLCFLYHLCHR